MEIDVAESGARPRLFVVKLVVPDGGGEKLLGYAVTEQVAFIPAAPAKHSVRESEIVRAGIEELFKTSRDKLLEALPILAEKDSGGGGYTMFASVHGGSVHGGSVDD